MWGHAMFGTTASVSKRVDLDGAFRNHACSNLFMQHSLLCAHAAMQVKPYSRAEAEEYHKQQGDPRMAIDMLPSLIFEPRPIVNGKKAPPNRAANGHTHRSKFC